jgi:hypothetical protein
VRWRENMTPLYRILGRRAILVQVGSEGCPHGSIGPPGGFRNSVHVWYGRRSARFSTSPKSAPVGHAASRRCMLPRPCYHPARGVGRMSEGTQGNPRRLVGSVADGKYEIVRVLGEGGRGA